MQLLLVDDDQALTRFLERGLTEDGYSVRSAGDGQTALAMFEELPPDLVVLDLNLPYKNGIQVLAGIREYSSEVPVLILTGQNDAAARVECLNHGADDCMLKPFSMAELKARCRALLRRGGGSHRLLLRYADLTVNRVEHTVERSGKDVVLTRTEYALLECLLLNRGSAVSRARLLEEVWHESAESGTNIVDVYINYLRRKLEDNGPQPLIQTVRGLGYAIGIEKQGKRRSYAAQFTQA